MAQAADEKEVWKWSLEGQCGGPGDGGQAVSGQGEGRGLVGMGHLGRHRSWRAEREEKKGGALGGGRAAQGGCRETTREARLGAE